MNHSARVSSGGSVANNAVLLELDHARSKRTDICSPGPDLYCIGMLFDKPVHPEGWERS